MCAQVPSIQPDFVLVMSLYLDQNQAVNDVFDPPRNLDQKGSSLPESEEEKDASEATGDT